MEEIKNNLSIVDEAAKLRDEIRAENDRHERLLKEQQKLEAERMLSSSAGQATSPQLTEEQFKKQEAMKFWKGTAIEEAINKFNG